mgnify:CR=1 FL=1
MEEITLYLFTSEIKSFLKKLSTQPITCELNEKLKEMGFTKNSLTQELVDRNFIKKNRKIENGETNKEDRYSISYEFFSKGFERKMERFYNDWKKKNAKRVNESTAAGAVTPGIGANSTEGNTGAFVKPLELEDNESNVIRKSKKIYLTQKQLDEATTTFNTGNYQYDVPFGASKNDPTLSREPGFSMKRLK